MTDAEIDAFLEEPHSAGLVSIGEDGYPHATAMFYVVRAGLMTFATYARSQKVRNLERNPKAAVLVETGHDYSELRGVLIQGDADLRRAPDLAGDVMIELASRYWGFDPETASDDAIEMIRERGSKRTVVVINPVRVVSWDHNKLSGGY